LGNASVTRFVVTRGRIHRGRCRSATNCHSDRIGIREEGVSKRHFLEQPGERKGNRCEYGAEQEDGLERVDEGEEILLADGVREGVYLGGVDVDASAET
jgi:hypothetical protein